MGIVTVPCPKTGDQVSTGVVIDRDAFTILDFQGQQFRCDACGEVHVWTKQEVKFTPENGP